MSLIRLNYFNKYSILKSRVIEGHQPTNKTDLEPTKYHRNIYKNTVYTMPIFSLASGSIRSNQKLYEIEPKKQIGKILVYFRFYMNNKQEHNGKIPY